MKTLDAEIAVVENLAKQAGLLRNAAKNNAHKAKAAAEWEIKLNDEVARLRSEAALLPGFEEKQEVAA